METTWPVSIKGVVLAAGHVLLMANDRAEWELPGGRLEAGESPQECVAREVFEETGLHVTVEGIIDSWVYPVLTERTVLIVTYGCSYLDVIPEVTVSVEHNDARFVALADCDAYPMPQGYRQSIAAWAAAGR